MADVRKIILPIIKSISTPPGMDKRKVSVFLGEHISKARKMSIDELREQHVYWYDRWCWDTGTPEDRKIYLVYEAFIKHKTQMSTWARDMASVQPMTGPVGEIFTIKTRYETDTEEE
jgi:hypothetical protein